MLVLGVGKGIAREGLERCSVLFLSSALLSVILSFLESCSHEAHLTFLSLFLLPLGTSKSHLFLSLNAGDYGGTTAVTVDLRSVRQGIHDDDLCLNDDLTNEARALPGEEPVKKVVIEIKFFPTATTRDTILDESEIMAPTGCGGCCLDDDGLRSIVVQICSLKR
jgi:hypothetical protein